MHCMKCGKKIEDLQVFCADCLTEMEKYPIKANVTVQLPPRSPAPPIKKKPRRRDAKPEEQVRHLRLVNRCLLTALTVTLAAFALTAVMLLHLIDERDSKPNIGQNYGTITETKNN